jgi:hypothetical protein
MPIGTFILRDCETEEVLYTGDFDYAVQLQEQYLEDDPERQTAIDRGASEYDW